MKEKFDKLRKTSKETGQGGMPAGVQRAKQIYGSMMHKAEGGLLGVATSEDEAPEDVDDDDYDVQDEELPSFQEEDLGAPEVLNNDVAANVNEELEAEVPQAIASSSASKSKASNRTREIAKEALFADMQVPRVYDCTNLVLLICRLISIILELKS